MLLVNFPRHLLFLLSLQICSWIALDWLLWRLMVRRMLLPWWHHQQVLLFFKLIQLRRCFVADEIVSFRTCMFLHIFTSLRILSSPSCFEMGWRRVRFQVFILQALLLWPAFMLFMAENILSFIILKFSIITAFFHDVLRLLPLKIILCGLFIARRASLPIRHILSSTIRIDSIFSRDLALFAHKRWLILHPEFQIINLGGIPPAWLKCQIGDDWTMYAHSAIALCIQIQLTWEQPLLV